MKKVCFIELQPFPTTIGGGITHLIELSKELKRKGYEVSVISGKPSKEYEKSKELEGINIIHLGIKHKAFADAKGFNKIGYYLWRVLFELSFLSSTARFLRKNNYDIIDAQSPITPSLACVLSGKEFYITAHGVHHQGFQKLYNEKGEKFVAKIAGKIYEGIEKFCVKRARKIICLGKQTYDYYKNKAECVIIPNGIDTERFSPGKGKRGKTIISVGRFTEQKAIDKLIESMDLLPDYKLQIVGLGPLESKIKQMCAERKNCVFLGYKNQEEIARLLKRARFTILPSLFEGLPISMLESMSSGVIPISTKVGDIPSLIKPGKNGFLLGDNKPETIAKRVKSIENIDLNKISDNASREIRSKFSWERIAKEFVKQWN